jgi:N-acyl-D-aspartate/D-glutamate deacylase
VVFDPQQIADRATFSAPYQYPQGINYVFVNGTLAVREGEYNRALAGKVLRKAVD